jgi:hypothetical protein
LPCPFQNKNDPERNISNGRRHQYEHDRKTQSESMNNPLKELTKLERVAGVAQ